MRGSDWLPRAGFFQRYAALFAVGDVGHVRGDGRAMAKVRGSIRRLPRANAIEPVGHMVFVGRAAGEGFALRPVHFFRIVMVPSLPSSRSPSP